MKLTSLIIVFLLVSTIVMADDTIYNFTLSGRTEIALDGATLVKSYIYRTEDGSDFVRYDTAVSTEGFSFIDGAVGGKTYDSKERYRPTVLFYIEGVNGTVFELLISDNTN